MFVPPPGGRMRDRARQGRARPRILAARGVVSIRPRPAHREAQGRRERAARAAAGGSQRGGSMDVEEGELAGAEKSTGCSCMEGDRMGCLRNKGWGGTGGFGDGGVGSEAPIAPLHEFRGRAPQKHNKDPRNGGAPVF